MDVQQGVQLRESKKDALKKGGSKKKPAQPKKNDSHTRQDIKIQRGATGEKCVAGPVVTTSKAKKRENPPIKS